jgi:protocatechuate 3,4-dioxygenase beta subunit
VLKCVVLAPEETEGPFYIPREKVRSNIVENRDGAHLALTFTVIDASTCKPIKGAAVDIWHCDAEGAYSGFGNGGTKTNFLRGIQRTDASGRCRFHTVYPGWYQGRTVHIHVKVHVVGNVAHTGQLYFNDSFTARVYKSKPYKARASARDTFNGTDSIFLNGGGPQSMLTVKAKSGGGYSAAISLGVRRK